MTRTILAACAVVLALAACGEDSTGPRPIAAGSVTFNVPAIGSRAAETFLASGAVQLDAAGRWQPGTWAFAAAGPEPDAPLDVYATASLSSGLYDHLRMELPREVRAGAVLEVRSYCDPADLACSRFEFFLAANLRSLASDAYCSASSGTVRVTARDRQRIAGTFDLPVDCLSLGDRWTRNAPVRGTFDLPVVEISAPVRPGV